jgi:DNA-binding NarL/FixJ family response regulator
MKLQGLLAEVENIIGTDGAIKFAVACGGTRIYIPAQVQADHWLVEAVGSDAAHKLAKHFSFDRRGIRLDVPMIPRGMQVNTLTEAGASAREIALKLGIHQRTVHSHRRKQRRRPTRL